MNRIAELKELRKEAKNIRKMFADVDQVNLTDIEQHNERCRILRDYQVVCAEYYKKKFFFQPSMPRITYKDKS